MDDVAADIAQRERSNNNCYASAFRYCRDTIFNGPGTTLGSYVKGPNNMICREWDRKAGPWSLGNGLVRIFMEALYEGGFGLYN